MLFKSIILSLITSLFCSHLFMKEGSLFVLYRWDPPNWDASDHILRLFGKLLRRRGASGCVHGVWTGDVQVLEYWMISSLKIKLSHSWNFRGIGMCLWCCWNLMSSIKWNLFGKIWIQNVGDIYFKVISATENSKKKKKPGFGRKNQLRTW